MRLTLRIIKMIYKHKKKRERVAFVMMYPCMGLMRIKLEDAKVPCKKRKKR